jgi:hypothetical protein
MSTDTEIVDAPASGPVDAPAREWRDVVEELESNGYVRLLTMLEKAGASNRAIARLVGMSEATIRRDFATFDAVRSGKFNDINSGDDDTATNDASPPLNAILRNLPKLSAAERDVVRKELDIADIEQPEAAFDSHHRLRGRHHERVHRHSGHQPARSSLQPPGGRQA